RAIDHQPKGFHLCCGPLIAENDRDLRVFHFPAAFKRKSPSADFSSPPTKNGNLKTNSANPLPHPTHSEAVFPGVRPEKDHLVDWPVLNARVSYLRSHSTPHRNTDLVWRILSEGALCARLTNRASTHNHTPKHNLHLMILPIRFEVKTFQASRRFPRAKGPHRAFFSPDIALQQADRPALFVLSLPPWALALTENPAMRWWYSAPASMSSLPTGQRGTQRLARYTPKCLRRGSTGPLLPIRRQPEFGVGGKVKRLRQDSNDSALLLVNT